MYDMKNQFRFKPLTLREANSFVKQYHRHSIPVRGLRFAVGLVKQINGELVGVAIAGRPIARALDKENTLEVTRVATDGTPNANSMLYSRVKQIGQLMGYDRILTYTLESESGASLRAVKATPVTIVPGHEWSRPSRPRKSQKVYNQNKIRWEL